MWGLDRLHQIALANKGQSSKLFIIIYDSRIRYYNLIIKCIINSDPNRGIDITIVNTFIIFDACKGRVSK